MITCYLRFEGEYLQNAERFPSLQAAIDAFTRASTQLHRYGQNISASVHFAPSIYETQEYPDRILSTGPCGGIRIERT